MSEISLPVGDDLGVSWNDNGTWSLAGSLTPGNSALRVLTATVDGALLMLASVRPQGADAHDEEKVTALLLENGGKRTEFDEVLLSTQYDSAGSVRRVGLELYPEGDDYPSRGAGDTIELGRGPEGDHSIAKLDFRFDGRRGTAVYEIIHA